MRCPLCKISMEKAIVSDVEADYCPRCYGLWLEEDELQWAKDAKDRSMRWLDIDLWKRSDKFHVGKSKKACPADHLPLYEVRYGDSDVSVDICNLCRGIWLDRGEFKDIIAYLHDKGEYEALHHYTRHLLEELWEVFSGPEILREEIADFLTIVKLLNYKFAAQHPHISQLMLAAPF